MATMNEKRRTARALAYLGEPSKILAALANTYGSDERMPSRAEIAGFIAERDDKRFQVYAQRRVA